MSNTLTTTTSDSNAVAKGGVAKGAAVGVIGIIVAVALDNFMGWGLVDKFQDALPKRTGTKTNNNTGTQTDTTPGTGDAT